MALKSTVYMTHLQGFSNITHHSHRSGANKLGIYDEYVGNHAVVLAPSQSIRQRDTSFLCRNISLAAKEPCHRRRHCPLLLSVQVLYGLYQGLAPEKKIVVHFPPNKYMCCTYLGSCSHHNPTEAATMMQPKVTRGRSGDIEPRRTRNGAMVVPSFVAKVIAN